MVEKALIFHREDGQWHITDDKALQTAEIERLPIAVLLRYADVWRIWCTKHRRFETVTEMHDITYDTNFGCRIRGLSAALDITDDVYFFKKEYTIPVRWRFYQKELGTPLFIGVDVMLLRFRPSNDPMFHNSPVMKNFNYKGITFSMLDEVIRYSYTLRNVKISFPTAAADVAIDILKDTVEKHWGLRPTTETGFTGINKLEAFFYRPFDMNSYALKPFFYDFDTLVPKDCKNAYSRLCEKLSIIRPPKSLRKIYTKNPYALLMFKALKLLGFTDYNLMRPFFTGTRIGDIDFSQKGRHQFPFLEQPEPSHEISKPTRGESFTNTNSDMISQAEIDALLNGGAPSEPWYDYADWDRLSFLVSWSMQEKGELWTARRLLKYSLKPWKRWEMDICRMMIQNFDEISDNAKQMFFQRGLTLQLHDILVKETSHQEVIHEEIIYKPYERDWECEINGFRFELPARTDDIQAIGIAMNNCVASYIYDALHKYCTIIAVRKGKEFVGCIEIREREIKQALGIGNALMEGELLHAVNYWYRRMLFGLRTEDLVDFDFLDMPLEHFHWEDVPGQKTYFLYGLDELMQMPTAEIGAGYYRALGTKLTCAIMYSQEHHHEEGDKYSVLLKDLPMNRKLSDKEIIHAACPAFDPIVRAAYEGNGEAQWVLYHLFDMPLQIVPTNLARSEFWGRKAGKSGEPGFPPLYRRAEQDLS